MTTQPRPASPLDYTLSIPPLETSGPRPGNDWNGRLVVKAGDGCCNWLTSIPNAIRRFFIHAYVDARLFFRAFSSMGSGTGPREIDRRINEVTQFLTVLENEPSAASATWDFNAVRNRYHRLSPQVRDLFFNVDQNYVNEFGVDQTLWSPQEMRDEMIRESQRVISFQRQLTAVNTFYRLFSGNAVVTPVSTSETTTTTVEGGRRRPRPYLPETEQSVRWEDVFGRFLGGPRGGGLEEREEVTIPVTTSTHNFDLNIPGTVLYVQNGIPADVQGKADEINNLRAQFAALRNPPAVPTIYSDVIMADDFMAIPVFDASHPAVQNALRGANAAGATTLARDALENRDFRHLFDKDALEAHIRAGTTWAPAKCPTCRHPQDGGIRRQYLRIDTALQDQILEFMRTAVAAGGATSSTTT